MHFGDDIKKVDITMDKANDEQNKLAQIIKKVKVILYQGTLTW